MQAWASAPGPAPPAMQVPRRSHSVGRAVPWPASPCAHRMSHIYSPCTHRFTGQHAHAGRQGGSHNLVSHAGEHSLDCSPEALERSFTCRRRHRSGRGSCPAGSPGWQRRPPGPLRPGAGPSAAGAAPPAPGWPAEASGTPTPESRPCHPGSGPAPNSAIRRRSTVIVSLGSGALHRHRP